jgi:hypothetical protein
MNTAAGHRTAGAAIFYTTQMKTKHYKIERIVKNKYFKRMLKIPSSD